MKLLVYGDGTNNHWQVFLQPEELTQAGVNNLAVCFRFEQIQNIWILAFFLSSCHDNHHHHHQFVTTRSNWIFLSDLRMEEKKKSNRSRLRLFPSFSVKTGVFNKQVSMIMLMNMMMMVRRKMMIMMQIYVCSSVMMMVLW